MLQAAFALYADYTEEGYADKEQLHRNSNKNSNTTSPSTAFQLKMSQLCKYAQLEATG